MKKLFTSESVTEGHPDKVCDQISRQRCSTRILAQDPDGARGVRVLRYHRPGAGDGRNHHRGCYVDIDDIARNTMRRNRL